MRKQKYKIILILTAVLFAAGCGEKQVSKENETDSQQKEPVVETEKILEELFFTAEEAGDVPTIVTEYAEEEEYPKLAEFLASYYGIPEEAQRETRYYYNRIDLNEDGRDEIFAVVIGEYTKGDAGDPALLLEQGNGAEFMVLDAFAQIRTPVTISDNMTNGWHDIIFDVYGKGVEDGYLICHYNPEGGYQTEDNAFMTELEPVSGTQILSNNLIDDMDKGNYFTLKK